MSAMLRRRDAWLDDLARIPVFAACTAKERNKIAHHIDRLRFDAGATVIRQGGPGGELFVIDEGQVDVVRDGRVVDTMGPGDHFGEMAILDSARRNATVRALSPLRVFVLPAAHVRDLLEEIPGLRERFVAMNARRRAG
jgi:CRP/FNR family transcriptional regulator, cyclic AMP receptor protein